MGRGNPYAARGVQRPWVTVDYYLGLRIVHGRYRWRWSARLAPIGILKVEHDA